MNLNRILNNCKSIFVAFIFFISVSTLSAQDSVKISKAKLDSLITNQLQLKPKKVIIKDTSAKYSKHSMYFEAAGRGIVYSLNYEVRLSKVQKTLNTSFRIGVGYFGMKNSYSNYTYYNNSNGTYVSDSYNRDKHHVFIPYSINLDLGKDKHKFEISYGQTISIQSQNTANYYSNYDPYYYNSSSQYVNLDNIEGAQSPTQITLNNNISFGYKRVPREGGVYFKAYTMIWLAPITISSSKYELVDNQGNLLYTSQRYSSNTFDFITDAKFIPYVGVAIGYTFPPKTK